MNKIPRQQHFVGISVIDPLRLMIIQSGFFQFMVIVVVLQIFHKILGGFVYVFFLYLDHIFVISAALIFCASSLALGKLHGCFSDIEMALNDIYQLQVYY